MPHIADQHGLQTGLAVFAGGRFGHRVSRPGGIGILQSLALPNGVVGEHDESIQGKKRGGACVAGVAGWSVSRRHQNCRARVLCCVAIGEIQQRRDAKAGLTLEDHLPDAKSVRLGLAQSVA
jgi:hypothetical protein